MKRTRPLLAVLAVAALGLGACSRYKPQGPDSPTTAPGADANFCAGIKTFRQATANLTSQGLTSNPTEVQAELTAAHDMLVRLADIAPTVPGEDLKGDLRTVAANYDIFTRAVAAAKGDPQAMTTAAINFKSNLAVNAATGHVDAYGHKFCGLNTEAAQPTVTSPTTAAGVGPAVPTTGTANPGTSSTTAVPPATTAPATTTTPTGSPTSAAPSSTSTTR